jgi:hypothetical protein
MRPNLHTAKRYKTLAGSATARLTAEEEERVRQRAAEARLTTSEWCRRAIVQALDAGPETRLLLAELMALRKIFLTIHAEVLQGQEPSAQRWKVIVDDAEATKYAMADQRIQKLYSGESAA